MHGLSYPCLPGIVIILLGFGPFIYFFKEAANVQIINEGRHNCLWESLPSTA